MILFETIFLKRNNTPPTKKKQQHNGQKSPSIFQHHRIINFFDFLALLLCFAIDLLFSFDDSFIMKSLPKPFYTNMPGQARLRFPSLRIVFVRNSVDAVVGTDKTETQLEIQKAEAIKEKKTYKLFVLCVEIRGSKTEAHIHTHA